MNIKLSVVDQSPVHGSHSKKDAPLLTVELAKHCDEWNYHRYWVAEHHDSVHFANPCPEILVAHLASITQRIKVGSGGVMLSNYSPLKVAECFSMLASLFPGRIDLGVGRAPGGSAMTSAALAFPNKASNGQFYAEQADLLASFIHGSFKDNHPFSSIHVMPEVRDVPDLWMLGSSGGSAELAGQLGYHLALARFIDSENCHPRIFDAHQKAWQQAGHEHPLQRMLAIACICADTEGEAKLRAGTAVYRKFATHIGEREDFLTPAQVRDRYHAMPASHQALFDRIEASYTIGTPEQCWAEIESLAEAFNTDEISLVTVTHSQSDRLDSYRLLAKNL
ncbi:MAG: MsnO8 family LLM class oxidoreductase [Gammaproteobacteria bacterium]|jgi:luciferase family oxidoreductase group 1|nr:MsnO8 family LLM class oxidoreductase [Gammaproteobacteria bacterium]MBU1466895.1 MsnO8 family LLM class oxidoreductase [Gammaproteobacteria bacterium]MBU2022952.1 MsnO8 family LLM class oxidoreductase [Gammaproteobacteria bacterium]MBU2237768.1 MsnO8 family LLM class oxidoreductase [Gammaproteobacteria bacterium]MBU2319903.1 MsnO8 family LLM class oxidoreductase [Gammaproteobacteria bacterium]